MRARNLGLATACVATALGTSLTMSAPAFAGSGWTYQYSAIVGSETYQLKKNGDTKASSTAKSNATIILKDAAPDGLGQRVYWRVNGTSTWKVCNHTGGDGTSKTCSVTNDRFIQYQFCVKDGSTIVACAPQDGFQT